MKKYILCLLLSFSSIGIFASEETPTSGERLYPSQFTFQVNGGHIPSRNEFSTLENSFPMGITHLAQELSGQAGHAALTLAMAVMQIKMAMPHSEWNLDDLTNILIAYSLFLQGAETVTSGCQALVPSSLLTPEVRKVLEVVEKLAHEGSHLTMNVAMTSASPWLSWRWITSASAIPSQVLQWATKGLGWNKSSLAFHTSAHLTMLLAMVLMNIEMPDLTTAALTAVGGTLILAEGALWVKKHLSSNSNRELLAEEI